jgi:hypothetical protein
MIHLRRFNESSDDTTLIELQDFCEASLVYLLDEDFTVNVGRIRPKRLNYFNISIGKGEYFKWVDINDHIIPFLLRLSKRYKLESLYGFGPIEFYFREGKGDKQEPTRDIYVSLEDILNNTGDMKLVSKEGSVILGMWIKIKVGI